MFLRVTVLKGCEYRTAVQQNKGTKVDSEPAACLVCVNEVLKLGKYRLVQGVDDNRTHHQIELNIHYWRHGNFPKVGACFVEHLRAHA